MTVHRIYKNGPVGSAVCVYSADNTLQTGGDGRSQSVFDVFRENVTFSPDSSPVDNSFFEVRIYYCYCNLVIIVRLKLETACYIALCKNADRSVAKTAIYEVSAMCAYI